MGAIGTTKAAVGSLTIDQLQAEAISPDELNVSLSGIYQALANLENGLGSQLSSAGAMPGELRVFNAAQAPAKWTEVDRSGAPAVAFSSGVRSLMCKPRALTSSTSNTGSACVAGEHQGYVYYTLVAGTNQCYLERMDIATGVTSAVATLPYSSYSLAGGMVSSLSAIVGDYLYVFSGYSSFNVPVSVVYRINLLNVAAGWTQLQSIPTPVFSASTPVVVGSKIYLFGGLTSLSPYTAVSTVQVFNTASLTWSALGATIPFGVVENCQCAPMPDGVSILCVGGYNGSAEIRKYTLLNTTTGQFSAVADLPSGWYDRPRALFKIPGEQIVRGLCWVQASGCTVVEFDGTTWVATGIPANFYGNVLGALGLSDGCSFQPATLLPYQMPHCKHAHTPAAYKGRLLCAYTG